MLYLRCYAAGLRERGMRGESETGREKERHRERGASSQQLRTVLLLNSVNKDNNNNYSGEGAWQGAVTKAAIYTVGTLWAAVSGFFIAKASAAATAAVECVSVYWSVCQCAVSVCWCVCMYWSVCVCMCVYWCLCVCVCVFVCPLPTALHVIELLNGATSNAILHVIGEVALQDAHRVALVIWHRMGDQLAGLAAIDGLEVCLRKGGVGIPAIDLSVALVAEEYGGAIVSANDDHAAGFLAQICK